MESEEEGKKTGEGTILDEMVIARQKNPRDEKAGLVVENSESSSQSGDFANQIRSTLEETEREMVGNVHSDQDGLSVKTWQVAREITTQFRPVPWFIWRICNYSLGTSGEIHEINEGMVFGLRRLIYAAASDPYLGAGEKVNDVRKAIKIVPSDVIAAVSVIHAICRRLASSQFERIWRPILDDALLRARIGWMAGALCEDFGEGRSMLAGFSGRTGLAILIASGELEQARSSLEMLAAGTRIEEVGMALYGCDPLQVSAMVLMAAGCGRDAAYGAARFASINDPVVETVETLDQRRWLASFTICEYLRTGRADEIAEEHWNALKFDQEELRDEIKKQAKQVARRGHEWNWLV